MSYKRKIMPMSLIKSDALTSAMAGIGMNFAAKADHDANIEDALYFASIEGMENDDLRTLAVLVAWLETHARWINADRLYRLIANHNSDRVRAFWSAVAKWQEKDRRFARMGNLYTSPRMDLLRTGNDFLIGRHGEDGRFWNSPLRAPANVLRSRSADVLSPEELAKRHRAYRFRVMMGPTYRADMWAAMEADPSISVAELARRTYGSFATASQVRRDWKLLHAEPEIASNLDLSEHAQAL